MKNTEIIITDAIAKKVLSKEEVGEYLAKGQMIPLHTKRSWRDKGYVVKENEKACLVSLLWKYSSDGKETKDGTLVDTGKGPHYYQDKAFLYSNKQVLKLDENNEGDSNKASSQDSSFIDSIDFSDEELPFK